MADVRARAKASGSHFFDRGNSQFGLTSDKFFGPYVGPGGVFFVQHHKRTGKRLIKELQSNGHVRTVGDFNPAPDDDVIGMAREMAGSATRASWR